MKLKREISAAALIAATVLSTSVCSDPPSDPGSGLELPKTAGPIAGLVVSLSRGLSDTRLMAFVSVEPGSLDEGSSIVLTNVRDRTEVMAETVAGGFDPVALPVSSGDLLEVEVFDATGASVTVSIMPIPSVPPVVVRTRPPKGRTSVPLAEPIEVVFSEPISALSVTTENFRLSDSRGPVDVNLSLRDFGTRVEMLPKTALLPSTDYTLEIGTGVTDLTGETLQATETVPFQTVAGEFAAAGLVELFPDTLYLPVGSYSGFLAVVDSGTRPITVYPDTSLTWSTAGSSVVSVDFAGNVGAISIGEAYVNVEYKGALDSALVIVTESPPPGPFSVFPDGAVMPAGGFELQFDVRHPAGTERPEVAWSTTDPAVLVVDQNGLVTTGAPGFAFVVATAGELVDSADVEVYDPTPPIGEVTFILPTSPLLEVGRSLQLKVDGAAGTQLAVEWATLDPQIAAVDSEGLLTGVAVGTTQVVANFTDGSSTSASVEVVAAGSLGTLTLLPAAVTAAVGDTIVFEVVLDSVATALYADDHPGWSTESVGPNLVVGYLAPGVFEALIPGQATIGAHLGPISDTASVTVTE